MRDDTLLHELVLGRENGVDGERVALTAGGNSLSYRALATAVRSFASGIRLIGLQRGERVAIYLEKRPELPRSEPPRPAVHSSR